ncbi:glucosidase II beta subunit-like-domain-containing protein [Zopfochytrium polystomum]|nr:glucosidase II beta subunit-like-domain-containing protein [Zopfochytrium polystomum]
MHCAEPLTPAELEPTRRRRTMWTHSRRRRRRPDAAAAAAGNSVAVVAVPILLLAVAVLGVALAPQDRLLGVDPAHKAIYASALAPGASSFACLDASKSIPSTSINDDYCDCVDGSDEPGTSACLQGKFYCANSGFVGKSIPSSRVNDGICDTECCDGSDEYSGIVSCPNTCAKKAEAARKAEEEKARIVREGVRVKKTYIAFAKKARAERSSEIQKLESQISNMTARVEELKFAKSEAEAFESKVNAAKAKQKARAASADMPRRISACRSHAQDLRGHLEKQNERVSSLRSTLEHLVTLQQAEEGAAFQALLRDKPILKETLDRYEEFQLLNPNPLIDIPAEPDALQEALDGAAGADGGGGDDADNVDLGLLFDNPCEDPTASLSACLFHSFDSATRHLIVVVTSPFLWPGWTKIGRQVASLTRLSTLFMSPSEELQALKTDAALARTRLSDAESEKSKMEIRLKEIKERVAVDFGPEGEWDKLFKECIKLTSFEYEYELCFFDKVTQKPKSGGAGTSLGSFTRWGHRSEAPHMTAVRYQGMMFENGAHCWNGPARSVEVTIQCGVDNKILTVAEPSKCEYHMKIQSPAACKDVEQPQASAGRASSGEL